MTANGVEIIASETAFDGYFRVDRYRLKHRLHAGGWSGELIREVFERGHAACVLPYDPVADSVVLIEQFRMGPFARQDQPWLLEVVAGIIESGESPADVARRETKEESGLEILDLEPIADFYVSPGGASQFNKLYCARVDSQKADGIHGLDDEGEDIRVHVLRYAEIEELLDNNEIRDATSLVALLWLARHRENLRIRWASDA